MGTVRRFVALVGGIAAAASVAFSQTPHVPDLYSDDYWKRIRAIRAVADMPDEQLDGVYPTIVSFLADPDQSVRVSAASVIEARPIMPQIALPALYNNFGRPDGEEGMSYVAAVAAFGEIAVPGLCELLSSESWLIAERARDGLKLIERNIQATIDCMQSNRRMKGSHATVRGVHDS